MYIPTLNPEGNIIGVTLSNFDVTERKMLQLTMAEYSQELQGIIDAMQDGLVLLGKDRRILLVNPSMQRIFGYSAEELLGQPLSMLVPEEMREQHDRSVERFVASSETTKRVLTAKGLHADGHKFFMDTSIATLQSGASTKLLAIVRDITEQVKAQEEILSLNRTLESRVEERTRELVILNNEKNEFMGIAAHDLKNPLAGILTGAQILERYFNNDDSGKRFVDMIITASNQMLDIIANLLDVNKIESGLVSLVIQSVGLDILDEIIEGHQTRAANKGIILHYQHPQHSDLTRNAVFVLADKQSLRQILDNIISNAVKYSPHWKNVWVRVMNRIDESGRWVGRIEVQDEGPGLSEKDQQHLFQKFARLSAQPTAGENSTGLGLSIVKKLVEMQHGKVWCESTVGQGATFIVEFPAVENFAGTALQTEGAT